jgi:glutathione synthase/RimK-type ligase-like ATP-grasp enzyme
MILVVGSSRDGVYGHLLDVLRDSGYRFAAVDEDHPDAYRINAREDGSFCVVGGACTGSESVGAVFVRHAVQRELAARHLRRMSDLQCEFNHMFDAIEAPIANRPANASSNYSKPYQLGLLADVGLTVPDSLVTNEPAAAEAFDAEHPRGVIFKAVSNMPTFAQRLTPDRRARLGKLPIAPTLFQEEVRGADYRVHVVGERTFVTRLESSDVDYRRALVTDEVSVEVSPGHLPADVLNRCTAITRQLGLIMSGIDFKKPAGHEPVALELNPYPQFTFYERRSGQPITRTLVEYLIDQQAETHVFA